MQSAFERAFVAGRADPAVRPSADEWMRLLGAETDQLVVCPRCTEFYSPTFSQCPYCRMRSGQFAGFGLKWILAGTIALIFMLLLVAVGAWAFIKYRPLPGRHLRFTPLSTPKRVFSPTPAPATPTPKAAADLFVPGRLYTTTLEIDPGSPRRAILARRDQVIELVRQPGASTGAESMFELSWKSGRASMISVPEGTEPGALSLIPRETVRADEGWRDLRVSIGPVNEWSATYRVPWDQLGFQFVATGDEPEFSVSDVLDETPAADAGLQRNDRVMPIGLLAGAVPRVEDFFRPSTPGRDGEIQLRVFRGQPSRISAYVAVGEFKYSQQANDYVVLEKVGPQSRADTAGLRKGDTVIRIGGIPTRTAQGRIDSLLNRQTTFEVYGEAQVQTMTIVRDKQLRVTFPSFKAR
jgi:hypothetical protein